MVSRSCLPRVTAGRRSIEIAAATGAVSVAFPSISTGVYGYPIERAAEVAVAAVRASVKEHTTVREVVFCCLSAGDLTVYEVVLDGAASR